MAGSIYGINAINGINSIYGVSSIYGANNYRNYLSSIAGRPYSQAASLLNTAAANAFRTKGTPSESSSYLIN